MSRNGKVLIAMSGGVDSSVAACLLKEQGYECVGVFMWVGATDKAGALSEPPAQASPHPLDDAAALPPLQNPKRRRAPQSGCCSAGDACDARAVASRLGMAFYSVNFQAEFSCIIDYFVDEYARARTPNPCVVCNTDLKFGRLLKYADMIGAEYVATGHYARILRQNGQTYLARAVNLAKDQSYVLFGIRRADLPRCLFPVGLIADKAQVRGIAAALGLRVHDKPDSQEICFVPDNDFTTLVRARRPEAIRPGEIRDAGGRVLGTHDGIVNYTIGQRHGLRIAVGKPVYVTRLEAATNTVTVGSRAELLSTGLIAERANWLVDPPPISKWRPAAIKIRHQHTPAAGAVRLLAAASEREAQASASVPVEARFDQAQSAVTPGQAVVFYEGEIVLGGGWIKHAK